MRLIMRTTAEAEEEKKFLPKKRGEESKKIRSTGKQYQAEEKSKEERPRSGAA